MRHICVYHDNCYDGMMAALVVYKAFENEEVEFIPANYGDPELWEKLADLERCKIIMVDFSMKRKQMLHLVKNNIVIVLDHHRTAQIECEGLDFCIFDLEESGASLAWKYFFRGVALPRIIGYIRDRDLWRFELDRSLEVNAYIQSFPINLQTYEELYDDFQNSWWESIVLQGEAIERYKDTNVEKICKYAWMMNIGGFDVPVIFNNGFLQSEIGNRLCEMFPYAMFSASIFRNGSDMVDVYSLRSIGNFDVSAIAKQYGGGGHFNAAGFTMGMGDVLGEPE